MVNKLKVAIRLFSGFVFCALSTVVMLNSNLGLSPWDVFHQGISNVSSITIGEANIIVGIVFLIIAILLGEKLGAGTIINIVVVGYIIDFIIYLDIIPMAKGIFSGIVMMVLGLFFMAYGCYLYIGCGLGCGPRDAVMIGVNKKFNFQIKYVRTIMELSVMIIGIFLGGYIGIGTIISAIGSGYSIQIVFKIFKFDTKEIQHKSLFETIRLKSKIKS